MIKFKPFKRRTTLGVIWTVIMFLIAFSYAMFQGGFVSWFVFYSFLPIFLYTLAIGLYSLRDFTVEREIENKSLRAGETLKIRMTVTRKWRFPLFYLIVEDVFPKTLIMKDRDSDGHHKGLYSIHFKKKVVFNYEIPSIARGEYFLNKVMIKTGDIFGFIQKAETFEVEDTIIVYPAMCPIPQWQPLDHSVGGHHRSKKPFEYDLTSISSIRDYTPGDRLSWLDWKATARTNKLVTKQFEYPLNRDVIVVLDRTSVGEHIKETHFERAVSLTASLVKQSLLSGSAVGLVSIGEEQTFYKMAEGDGQFWQILNHLARTKMAGNKHPAPILQSYLNRLPQNTTCLFVGQMIDDQLIALFSECLYRGVAVEHFLVNDHDGLLGIQKWHQKSLKAIGVKSHLIEGDDFAEISRAGDRRATS